MGSESTQLCWDLMRQAQPPDSEESFMSALIRKIYDLMPAKQPIFELLRRHVRLPARVYQHLHFEAPINIPVSDGCSFMMHHFGAQVENDLFWAGYGNGWEATSLRLWARLAAAAETIFDIGANTGAYALAAKVVNKEARVFAFEPVASISDKLRSNVELNGFDITVVQAGVSGSTGEAVMYIPATKHSYSASLNSSMLRGNTNLIETVIPILRIDEFIRDHALDSADLFKIDTEKHEVDVPSGFGDIINKFKPAILIEILNKTLGGEVEAFFLNSNYVFYEIIEGVALRRVESLGATSGNYLLCTADFAASSGFGNLVPHAEI